MQGRDEIWPLRVAGVDLVRSADPGDPAPHRPDRRTVEPSDAEVTLLRDPPDEVECARQFRLRGSVDEQDGPPWRPRRGGRDLVVVGGVRPEYALPLCVDGQPERVE